MLVLLKSNSIVKRQLILIFQFYFNFSYNFSIFVTVIFFLRMSLWFNTFPFSFSYFSTLLFSKFFTFSKVFITKTKINLNWPILFTLQFKIILIKN